MFPNLVELDLSFTDLTDLSHLFKLSGRPTLKKLHLRKVLLNYDTGFVNNYVNLEEIDLSWCDSRNSSVFLPIQQFTALRKLEKIILSGLNLNSSYLDTHLNFSFFPNLKYLDLSDNRLTEFSESTLVALTSVVHLDLRGNLLAKFNFSAAFSYLTKLQSID